MLRRKAIQTGISVRGILYIFDLLYERQIISGQVALQKLTDLMEINTRLPKEKCDKRLDKWETGS